jgi:hypothetical protein
VAVDRVAVVGDQDGVERRRARLRVVGAENAQQRTVLVDEDLLEPL